MIKLLPALLLLLVFTLKLTIVTLFYLIYLQLELLNLQLVLNCAAHAVTKTLKFHHIKISPF